MVFRARRPSPALFFLGAKVTKQVYTYRSAVKDACQDAKDIMNDLESIVGIIGDPQSALQDPTKRNIFNSMNGKDNFQKVVNELHTILRTI